MLANMSAFAIIGFATLLGIGAWLLYGTRDLIGTKVTVYYDPKRPEVAVLRRGLQFGAVFGLVFIGAAFLWLFLTLKD